ncbi:hypothetical protein N9A94_02245 [Akkermansiaceae bacterium]|nr:hypothetical protein [Akkermansiaceae bacterium]
MHNTRRPGMAFAIRISSIFLIINRLAILSLIGSIGFAWYEHSTPAYWSVLISFLVSLFSWIFFAFWSARCRCQLCMAPLLSRAKCNEHSLAKKLFGSYRLRLAVAALVISRFRCYFCGEEFTLEPPPDKPDIGPVKDRHITTIRRSGSLPKKH